MVLREVMKMSVRIFASWSAHPLNRQPGTLSGPVVFCWWTLSRVLLTSAVAMWTTLSLGDRVAAVSFDASNRL